MEQKRIIFECVKKICKKYRYMMRSDDLYREMNYVIENLSEHLISSLLLCMNLTLESLQNIQSVKTNYGVMNSILHIIQSILGQEELPDFYEV